ncbi:hypothetical protein OHB01_05305 [Microbispora hainanensis]|jgi:hypothetical protein|uniref:Uncharacterized protein n=1 Tax=Microbispora hainanensis TaxID=568844 RepID=A0ABZ1SR30_9ACTN|nr:MULTISPECIES: hypothetical protein [Microbispora]
MSPKRGDAVAPPAVGDEWHLRFATSEAAKGWSDLCAEAAGNTGAVSRRYARTRCHRRTRTGNTGFVAAWPSERLAVHRVVAAASYRGRKR